MRREFELLHGKPLVRLEGESRKKSIAHLSVTGTYETAAGDLRSRNVFIGLDRGDIENLITMLEIIKETDHGRPAAEEEHDDEEEEHPRKVLRKQAATRHARGQGSRTGRR